MSNDSTQERLYITQLSELDTLVMIHTDIDTIRKTIYRINRHIHKIYCNDNFWKMKVTEDFGGKVIEHKPEEENFSHQHFYLTKVKDNKLYIRDYSDRADRLIVIGTRPYNPWNIDVFVKLGYLKCVKYLSTQSEDKYFSNITQPAVNAASYEGHFEMIKFLWDSYNKLPEDLFVSTSNLELIQFLISKGVVPIQYYADYYSTRGSLEVLKYLHETFGILPSHNGFNNAIRDRADTSTPQELIENLLRWMIDVSVQVTIEEIKILVYRGYINTLKYLHEKRGIELDLSSLNIAISCGYLDMAKWIIKTYNIVPTLDSAKHAII